MIKLLGTLILWFWVAWSLCTFCRAYLHYGRRARERKGLSAAAHKRRLLGY
jgi:hypothetical protein